ncbi:MULTISPECIES: hypothetical protein [Arcobacter]|uniref:DUF4412 domain-containing protein n=1 Tax=Arcobacter ellisii TaxID=913109 RepID=A0A347UAB3_9BACT|nr:MULTISPECIES: hypothetical protein [Arcobacter]AXX95791.1 hypothetical protein AELL_2151 [Arcobacter ellisii]MBD3831111.1 hypothetical protein [Arcobacter sp.]MDD3009443.1 hypothetical protein [Arcobacter sp.]MDY3205222.1 hypothetical protein [Arcobacter sp.]RXI29105.1 hypothetical protein CP962_12020 [Arcobacter ellisii]
MGKIRYILIFLLVGFVDLFAANRYNIKSGIVEYEIIGNTEGGAKGDTISGTSKLYFKDFGNLELTDERIIQTIMGEKEEERTISKIVNEKLLTVDFNDEVIYSQKLVLDEENPIQNIKTYEAFIQMGAKNLGTEEILGYKCEVWQLGEDKIWVYNTVPLKQVSQSLGIVQIQQAKFAVFNIDIKDDKFKLPSFPVKPIEEIIGDGEGEFPNISPEQEKMMGEMMKAPKK